MTKKSSTDSRPSPAAIAKQLLDLVATFEGILPDLVPPNPREIRRITSASRFAEYVIPPTLDAVASAESLREKNLFDVAAAQEALEYRDLVRPAAQRLAAFVAALEYTVDSKLAAAGEEALHTYRWVQAVARSSRGADLLPYMEEMRRLVKKAINRRPKKKPVEELPSSEAVDAVPEGEAK